MKEYTIKEAAKYVNKSESWIRKKILNNELEAEKKAFKYGQRYKIKKEDLDNYLEYIQTEKNLIEVIEKDNPASKEVIFNELQNIISEVIDQRDQELHKKIDNLTKEVKKLQENKTIFDKIKDFFKE